MSDARTYTKNDLLTFHPRFPTFVGIDSDGCLFPTMEVKQKQCFHPRLIACWHLEPIAGAVREVAEFVNLHSAYRGQNRFPALLKTFELLRDHPGARAAGIPLPPTASLRAFCESGLPLGNPALQNLLAGRPDPDLEIVLRWSLAVNEEIARTVKGIAPFPYALRSLERIREHSDAICVSQTPAEALVREWEEHGLLDHVRVIAGQELGSKSDHLVMATRDRYPPDRVLLIGDAPGDLKAARAVGVRFFPINPGHEDASWQRFHETTYDRFLAGRFTPEEEAGLVREFEALLPAAPPWGRA
jgi:phosphoglycolate phosphatase-like HAD superfamily hydrolase